MYRELIRSIFRRAVAVALICASAVGSAIAEERVPAPLRATHPMDGLTADEIVAAAGILRAAGKFDQASRLVSLSLEENPKEEVRAWTPGAPFTRHAFAIILRDGALFEARIDLSARKLSDWKAVP